MKRILALVLSIVLMLGIAVPAYATGDGNIDGGGGGMGNGTSSNYWNPGMDGVRISIVNVNTHAVVTTPVDLTNKTPASGIIHFGKVSKLSYNAGRSLSPVVGNYTYRNPGQSLPRIISSGSYPASIDAIRSYFTDEQVIRSIAGYVGMSFDILIGGDYKIVIEPLAYFVYGGAYPILSDLYDLIEEEFKTYDASRHQLYTEKLLQEVLLGLHSMCKGADAQFFNGHTNITSSRFLVFGVKGMLSAAKNVRNAMLFNVLSFMSDKLLTVGNTVAALDELYIWLSNPTAIEYIRNCLKRVRKKESAMLLASQNLEDFDQEGIREMTKPLFSIPPHQFLFNAGSIDKRSYMEMLQLEESEYNLIKFPQRGVCLYKCGNERYLLEVHAPAYKEKLFGTAGGR